MLQMAPSVQFTLVLVTVWVDLVSTDINGDGNTDVLAVNAANDRLKLFVGNNLGELHRIPICKQVELHRRSRLPISIANQS